MDLITYTNIHIIGFLEEKEKVEKRNGINNGQNLFKFEEAHEYTCP